MAMPQNVIAVIFDFDDTLTNESTTKLLEAHGINANEFWGTRQNALLKAGWDPAIAYLKLILDETGEGKPLGKLTNEKLKQFGAGLEFYQGIPEIFDDLCTLARKNTNSNPSVEFYVISGGLEEIIKGTKYAHYFRNIWGCRFYEENGQLAGIMNAISFTEKTKFIYAINKGIMGVREKPFDVNEEVKSEMRRIPFENMIYIGDGLTDVPCFSLLKQFGGASFGVFDPTRTESPKKAWEKLVIPDRVKSIHSPKYGATDDLGALLRAAVARICLNIEMRTQTALG